MLHTPLISSVETQRVARSVHIRRPAHALYTAWYHLSQRPTVPLGTEALSITGSALPRIKVPCGHTAGPTFIEDHIHGLFISWKSQLASGVTQAGEVWFHTNNAGIDSTVTVLLSWNVPAHAAAVHVGDVHADLVQLDQDLHHFKSLMER